MKKELLIFLGFMAVGMVAFLMIQGVEKHIEEFGTEDEMLKAFCISKSYDDWNYKRPSNKGDRICIKRILDAEGIGHITLESNPFTIEDLRARGIE